MRCAFIFLPLVTAGLIAAESDGLTHLRDDLRAIDEAHSRQGTEVAAWRAEDERLGLAIEALRAQLIKTQAEASAAEAVRDDLRSEREKLITGEIVAAQQLLSDAARAVRAQIQTLATTAPPGILVPPTDDSPEAVLKALELSARAVDQVTVSIAAGHRAGESREARTAVRFLRAASLGWWMALDGRDAGIARMVDGVLELEPVEPAAQAEIRRAIGIAEGRGSAELVILPRVASTGGAP